ncbi:MAG: hypothetical protein NWR80_04460, partial [Burkholderiaceae bacterium]|nr:hypothetical protein [Burkholderiaceae bacterium]
MFNLSIIRQSTRKPLHAFQSKQKNGQKSDYEQKAAGKAEQIHPGRKSGSHVSLEGLGLELLESLGSRDNPGKPN